MSRQPTLPRSGRRPLPPLFTGTVTTKHHKPDTTVTGAGEEKANKAYEQAPADPDHGHLVPGGCNAKSENPVPANQAPSLVIEWTADLARPVGSPVQD